MRIPHAQMEYMDEQKQAIQGVTIRQHLRKNNVL